MEIINNAQEIRTRLEQFQANKDPKLKNTMSVPEMRRLLGLKKTESYWLVHRNFFETRIIDGRMRVDLESFEKWYANQVKHKKVNGEEPGAELLKTSYSFMDAANLLGIHNSTLYEIWRREKTLIDIAEEQGITYESAQQQIHRIRLRVKKQVVGFMDGKMGGIA